VIGCKTLCGACEECGPLVWALAALDRGVLLAKAVARRTQWGQAILDPAAIADLLARALQGRGVDVVEHGANAGIEETWPWVSIADGQTFADGTPAPMYHSMMNQRARDTLARLLALPLDCGAEKAIYELCVVTPAAHNNESERV
jgi:hypothetical protein